MLPSQEFTYLKLIQCTSKSSSVRCRLSHFISHSLGSIRNYTESILYFIANWVLAGCKGCNIWMFQTSRTYWMQERGIFLQGCTRCSNFISLIARFQILSAKEHAVYFQEHFKTDKQCINNFFSLSLLCLRKHWVKFIEDCENRIQQYLQLNHLYLRRNEQSLCKTSIFLMSYNQHHELPTFCWFLSSFPKRKLAWKCAVLPPRHI